MPVNSSSYFEDNVMFPKITFWANVRNQIISPLLSVVFLGSILVIRFFYPMILTLLATDTLKFLDTFWDVFVSYIFWMFFIFRQKWRLVLLPVVILLYKKTPQFQGIAPGGWWFFFSA